jgi:mono/diheme cytochrome c family protein
MKPKVIMAAALASGALALGAAGAMRANAQAAPREASLARGHQVFDKWCAPCHGAGLGKPATAALAFKYKGEKPALLEERTDLTPEIVKYMVRNGVYTMPASRKTEISDDDLDALAAYLSKAKAAGR